MYAYHIHQFQFRSVFAVIPVRMIQPLMWKFYKPQLFIKKIHTTVNDKRNCYGTARRVANLSLKNVALETLGRVILNIGHFSFNQKFRFVFPEIFSVEWNNIIYNF